MQLAAQGPQGGFLPGKGVGHLRADGQLIPPLTAVIPAQSGEGKQQGIELLFGKVVTINGDIADGGIAGKGLSCGIHDLPAGRRGLLGDGNALGRLAGVVLAIPQLGQHHHHHKKQKNGADGSAQDDIAFSLGGVHGRLLSSLALRDSPRRVRARTGSSSHRYNRVSVRSSAMRCSARTG